ncbi:hypothetical protein QO004_003978 [Rhizobium mesoamericanum]|uniref:hypothetical protein n=1 Tax=Rhizobium mesoamericanum TaxID=1079800 RepID=UPI002783F2B6|nr:hypothetical protein [Rhizobium mesoamericanum]MDQ0562177.1 hypothetical protein [Rhizobium mesoamericanum]
MHRQRKIERINGAAKLDESAVPNNFDDAAVVILDRRIEDSLPVMLQRRQRRTLAGDLSDIGHSGSEPGLWTLVLAVRLNHVARCEKRALVF